MIETKNGEILDLNSNEFNNYDEWYEYFKDKEILDDLEDEELEPFYYFCILFDPEIEDESEISDVLHEYWDRYFGYYGSEEDYCIEQTNEEGVNPEWIERYIDYHQMAKDWFSNGDLYYEGGYVFGNY